MFPGNGSSSTSPTPLHLLALITWISAQTSMALPCRTEWTTVTHLPLITDALVKKGYSETDIRKILGENTLRVLAATEQVSREM
jgi:microsomal dipeptidase-like Zn-dependent dipeptidase